MLFWLVSLLLCLVVVQATTTALPPSYKIAELKDGAPDSLIYCSRFSSATIAKLKNHFDPALLIHNLSPNSQVRLWCELLAYKKHRISLQTAQEIAALLVNTDSLNHLIRKYTFNQCGWSILLNQLLRDSYLGHAYIYTSIRGISLDAFNIHIANDECRKLYNAKYSQMARHQFRCALTKYNPPKESKNDGDDDGSGWKLLRASKHVDYLAYLQAFTKTPLTRENFGKRSLLIKCLSLSNAFKLSYQRSQHHVTIHLESGEKNVLLTSSKIFLETAKLAHKVKLKQWQQITRYMIRNSSYLGVCETFLVAPSAFRKKFLKWMSGEAFRALTRAFFVNLQSIEFDGNMQAYGDYVTLMSMSIRKELFALHPAALNADLTKIILEYYLL